MPLFGRVEPAGAPDIAGLVIVPNFVSAQEASELCRHIDGQPWRDDLKRRVQHYGYRYDYAARTVGPESYLGPLPGWLSPLALTLAAPALLDAAPDQVIVNEY